MLSTLRKYRHVFLVGLQSNIVYRWNFATRGFFSLFHLGVVFILWSAIFANNQLVGDFNFGQTITYFVTLLLLQFLIGAFNEDYQISEEIRNGLINQFLLKPVNYFLYRFTIYVSARLVSGLLIFLPLIAALPVIGHHLTFPHEWWRFALGIPAIMLSALIQFSIAYCFGLLTFWLTDIQGLVILSMALETLLGGQIFPLDLLPANIFRLVGYLPFFYQMYFPAAIFTGRLKDPSVIVNGLGVQLFWVVALLSLNQFLWRRGLRRHTAVGG